ncbi:hypothetical protein PsYK624_065540 [Phanerochaete sordida]|uniref:Uncharacterized protein n=1 Tax=Phanerochaete sordida TaxID=48140 RepID=A0A9P3G900_9APHY|nr:hypothetical protein PsYK624_065540 [Phanerochaete sordida]
MKQEQRGLFLPASKDDPFPLIIDVAPPRRCTTRPASRRLTIGRAGKPATAEEASATPPWVQHLQVVTPA